MRIIRNERHIGTFSFIGKYATLAGLMTLLAGLIISFAKPEWLWPLLVSLTAGIGLSAGGGFFAERYVGPLAHHDALAKALKGLDDDYALLQYVLPARHVLVEPGGCTAFVVKAQGGEVTYDREGERWKHRQRGKAFRQFAGQEGLSAPDLEARHQAEKLETWLSRHLPDVEVPVQAAIVFVNPNVALDADDSPVPAFYDKKVKGWLRGSGKLKPLPPDVHRRLMAALEPDT
jgi:hypothetical protein